MHKLEMKVEHLQVTSFQTSDQMEVQLVTVPPGMSRVGPCYTNYSQCDIC